MNLIEKIEDKEYSENFEEDSEDEIEIYEAYHQFFEESLRIKKIYKAVLKKVNELEI